MISIMLVSVTGEWFESSVFVDVGRDSRPEVAPQRLRSFDAVEVLPHPVAVAGLAQLQQGP